MAKVSIFLWQYADLKKVIAFDVGVRADLDRHGRLRSGATQGRQPWGVEVEVDLVGYEASAKRCKKDHRGRQWVVEPLSARPLIGGLL
jgi:hypothetical protein